MYRSFGLRWVADWRALRLVKTNLASAAVSLPGIVSRLSSCRGGIVKLPSRSLRTTSNISARQSAWAIYQRIADSFVGERNRHWYSTHALPAASTHAPRTQRAMLLDVPRATLFNSKSKFSDGSRSMNALFAAGEVGKTPSLKI